MLTRRHHLGQIAAVTAGAGLWANAAIGAVFLDIEQAQKLLLPQASHFAPQALALDTAALHALADATQTAIPRGYAPQCWQGLVNKAGVGWVLGDRAIGKVELIDFAAGFGADGTCTGVEILAYRESHGAEIRNAAWRRQFAGRKGPTQMRSGEDIRNISGATLSCQHVGQAVQRLAALVQTFVKA